jgi:hypothetical protein
VASRKRSTRSRVSPPGAGVVLWEDVVRRRGATECYCERQLRGKVGIWTNNVVLSLGGGDDDGDR